MNSLTDLNNYSAIGTNFQDNRSLSILFDGNVTAHLPNSLTLNIPSTLTGNIATGFAPYDITRIQGLTGAGEIYMTFAGSNSYGNPLPIGVSLTSGPDALHGVNSVAAWQYARKPEMTVSNGSYNQYHLYTPASSSYQWGITASVNANMPISSPAAISYIQDTPLALTTYPVIAANAAITNGQVTITPIYANAVSRITTGGTGGSVSSELSTSSITISGNTSQINSHLSTLTVTPAVGFNGDFMLNYALKNVSNYNLNPEFGNVYYQVNQSITSAKGGKTRTYTQNGTDLLFPNEVPTVPSGLSPTQSIHMQITLSDAVGRIGTDINDANWNASTNSYDNGSNPLYPAATDTLLTQLRFFPSKNTYRNTTVRLRLTNGSDSSKNLDITFDLVGSALPAYITGGDTSETITEDDVITNLHPFSVRPHYSEAFTVSYQTLVNHMPATVGTLSSSGWTATTNKITRTYAASTSLSAYNSNLADLVNPQLALTPDWNGTFVLRQSLDIAAGTYSVDKTIFANAAGEYTAPTTANINILNTLSLGNYVITDAPNSTSRTYTVSMNVGNVALGRFYIDGSSQGNTFTISGTRSQVNSKLTSNVTYVANIAPGSSTLTFNLNRTSPDTATLASNYSVPLNISTPAVGATWQGGIYIGATNDVNFGSYHRVIADAGAEATLSFKSTTSVMPYILGQTYYQYDGAQNTTTISNLVGYGANTAVGYCDTLTYNGKSDWYLATTDELKYARDANVITYGGTYWCSQVWDGGNGASDPYIGGLSALPSVSWGAPLFWNTITTSTLRKVRPMRRIAL